LPLIQGALLAAIVGLTRHRTVQEIIAAAGLIILSQAIVLALQLSLMNALLEMPRGAGSNVYEAIPGLLVAYSLVLFAIRLAIAVHERFVDE
jgi:hypothetical protein